jgi:hypothetical protein
MSLQAGDAYRGRVSKDQWIVEITTMIRWIANGNCLVALRNYPLSLLIALHKSISNAATDSKSFINVISYLIREITN